MLRSGSRFPAVSPKGIRRVTSADCWIGIIRRFLGRSSGMAARTRTGLFGRRNVAMRSSGPAEGTQARDVPAAARRSESGTEGQMVPGADQCQARRGSSRRPGDAGVPRDDLPGAVLAGPWRAADRAHPGAEARKSQACQQVSCLVQYGKIRDMVNVSERPPEAADRAVPGFWEGDLIIGKANASQIATLVERTTRFTMLVRIPYDRNAERVAKLLAMKMETLPELMRKSVTWDQGKEMARHADFSVSTGIDVYFCDPHSSWQRGTNENTNGLD